MPTMARRRDESVVDWFKRSNGFANVTLRRFGNSLPSAKVFERQWNHGGHCARNELCPELLVLLHHRDCEWWLSNICKPPALRPVHRHRGGQKRTFERYFHAFCQVHSRYTGDGTFVNWSEVAKG